MRPTRDSRLTASNATALAAAALALVILSSCAYYNTFFLARRNYNNATNGLPYAVDKGGSSALTQSGTTANVVPQYNKAIDYSKKVMGVYAKSKWVDDAYLMWAKSLIGKDDPGQAIELLEEFPLRYPESSLRREAAFYRALALRHSRKYATSLGAFDDFLASAPKHDLTPYAHLERSRVLLSLDRPLDAAEAASRVVEGWPKHLLRERALQARAEGLLTGRQTDKARADFAELGRRADNDDDRFTFLLREVDCYEAARDWNGALGLLRGAIGYEREPALVDTAAATAGFGGTSNRQAERWGRLKLRIGTVLAQSGNRDGALESFNDVIARYWRQPLAAEAQFRVGYVFETVADDFERAREEYGKVRLQSPSSSFVGQASQRDAQLARLAQYRNSTGSDSSVRIAEAALMRAELYLFQLDKPDRALEEYSKLASDLKGTPWEAKAMTAEAWVLRNKLDQPKRADSLWWEVVRHHPETEAQLAARDYLEESGIQVPDSLIKLPPVPSHADTVKDLLPPPAPTPTAMDRRQMMADSLLRSGYGRSLYGSPDTPAARFDSLGRLVPPGMLMLDPSRGLPARFRPDSLDRSSRDSLAVSSPPVPVAPSAPDSSLTGPPAPANKP
ncbi:MAG: tetratricopeptide repeat protein [Candidatus Eisenbacteria bacterium]|uniref:Tetratricopeptide repeat protein n=1 Tax=Eiseniibacteriota bacterium TaxID=2212470 RepID=A0A849SWL7_UNCEI|nr:tetratricopeptide repeat protein [Candidatus Eisenbacteria bacterium]